MKKINLLLNKYKNDDPSQGIEIEEWDEDQYAEGTAELSKYGEPYPATYLVEIDENSQIIGCGSTGCYINNDFYYQDIYDIAIILDVNGIIFEKIYDADEIIEIKN